MTTTAAPTYYEQLGGEDGVRRLVQRFYDLMDALPAARAARAVHPADVTHAREKLFLFLSGWLGGPSLYIERFGHPRLRARHMPFAIGDAERDGWMLCMKQALAESPLDETKRLALVDGFQKLADHMRNRT